MNRRSFFQAVIAALLLPKPAESLTPPWHIDEQAIPDWPEGRGDAEYNFMSPLLLRSDTSDRWDLRNS